MDVNPNFTPNIDWLQNWQQQDLNFSFEYAYAPENNFYNENLGLSSHFVNQNLSRSSQFVNQDSGLSTQFVTGDLNSNFSSQFSNSDWSPSSQVSTSSVPDAHMLWWEPEVHMSLSYDMSLQLLESAHPYFLMNTPVAGRGD
jgi:hypothetical protein